MADENGLVISDWEILRAVQLRRVRRTTTGVIVNSPKTVGGGAGGGFPNARCDPATKRLVDAQFVTAPPNGDAGDFAITTAGEQALQDRTNRNVVTRVTTRLA